MSKPLLPWAPLSLQVVTSAHDYTLWLGQPWARWLPPPRQGPTLKSVPEALKSGPEALLISLNGGRPSRDIARYIRAWEYRPESRVV